MTKPEWGSKHICAECGTRYYDMERTPVVCPSCDAPEKIVPAKTRRSAASRSAKRAAETKAPEASKNVVNDAAAQPLDATDTEAAGDVVASTDETDENEAVIEDVTELGEDEKDLAEVIDVAVEEKDTDT